MHLTTRNVNTAFNRLVYCFKHQGYVQHQGQVSIVRRQSRNGPVLMIDEPVMVTYTHPRERVLFNPARDANPFFHLYESLWMLAGRNDVGPLAYYSSNMANYSDDGRTLNGAYGYRWRHAKHRMIGHNGIPRDTTDRSDQLRILIDHLKADPTSRRAVLQMWSVEDDLLKIGGLSAGVDPSDPTMFRETKPSKDVCCNLSVYFSIRSQELLGNPLRKDDPKTYVISFLDMTVTNRSNDMIWGMLGANAVHFSVLQEYMAAQIDVEVGRYTQMTNNLHVYESNWKPDEWLAADRTEYHEPLSEYPLVPLVKNPAQFDLELPVVTRAFDGSTDEDYTTSGEPFLDDVVRHALTAFRLHKRKMTLKAIQVAEKITDDGWRVACTEWLQRRVKT